jgi:hypothetical protein
MRVRTRGATQPFTSAGPFAEEVPPFGRDDGAFAPAPGQGGSERSFARPVAVRVCGIEEADAEVEGGVDEPGRGPTAAMPWMAETHTPEPELNHWRDAAIRRSAS